MSIRSALEAHLLGLPPPRCRVFRSRQWVAMADGVRLATSVYRPALAQPRTTVLARVVVRQPTGLLARLIAEQGHRVVLQECRGLLESEGRFEPFLRDGADGADTLDWLAEQPGSGGPTALVGFGYAGHAAWATLAAARRRVDGLLVGFAARDPFAWLHTGGALELEHGFNLALALAAAEPEGIRPRAIQRALRFRPLRDADRVAARRIEWLREWLDHPHRDAFWEARTPPLPHSPPPALLIGGFHHPGLSELLDDHAALAAAARASGGDPPRLLVGPWPAARDQRSAARALASAREMARAALHLLDAIETRSPSHAAPVRVFGGGGTGWRDAAGWPPAASEQTLYLGGDGRAAGGGRLLPQPTADEPADPFVHDPADAVVSEGGALGSNPGAIPLGAAESRGDVLHYLGEPLRSGCELSGARALLYVSSDAPASDFTARLVRIDRNGTPLHLCDGIARVEKLLDSPAPVAIELAPVFQRLHAGERLRLDVASSSFPRFDRHANTEATPAHVGDLAWRTARHRIHHDARHPSCIRLAQAR